MRTNTDSGKKMPMAAEKWRRNKNGAESRTRTDDLLITNYRGKKL